MENINALTLFLTSFKLDVKHINYNNLRFEHEINCLTIK